MLRIPLPALLDVQVRPQRLPALHDLVPPVLLRYLAHLLVLPTLYHQKV